MEYELTVVQGRGAPQNLKWTAPSAQEAQQLAQAQGYLVLGVSSSPLQAWRQWRLSVPMLKSEFPLLLFAQELLALLRAGLGLMEGLSGLLTRATGASLFILQAVLDDLHEGRQFSQALRRHPDVFPELFCALVGASERTSDLPTALERYISYATQMEMLRKKLVNAAVYPALLMIVGGAVGIFLMTYVVPRFAGIYENIQGDLPWMSRALLLWGKFLSHHAPLVWTVLLTLMTLVVWAFSRPEVRQAVWQFVLRLRWVERYAQEFRLARLYRAVGMLLEGGIPLVEALNRVNALLPQTQQLQLMQARRMIEEGVPASNALQQAGLTTPIATQMLVVGERTGNLGGMMQRMAEFFEADTARALDVFGRIFEPALMALIGIVIGGVVILMYLPIFELAGSLQ